jgi:acetylornithine deacetylase/succinyl-diaminopimelate desuccinylase-like protein
MAAHFELHIKQGPLLEASRRKIGIVKGVQAYRWYTVKVAGRACHTGTTDFGNRADPLLAAAKMVLQSHRLATAHAALASMEIRNLKPGSTNTVPKSMRFSLDIRAPAEHRRDTGGADCG